MVAFPPSFFRIYSPMIGVSPLGADNMTPRGKPSWQYLHLDRISTHLFGSCRSRTWRKYLSCKLGTYDWTRCVEFPKLYTIQSWERSQKLLKDASTTETRDLLRPNKQLYSPSCSTPRSASLQGLLLQKERILFRARRGGSLFHRLRGRLRGASSARRPRACWRKR